MWWWPISSTTRQRRWPLAIAEQHGVRAIAVHADVTDTAQCEAMVDRTVAEFGKLDICVSNAGILISGEITEFDPARWRKVIEVNLVGYFNVARAAARVMKAQKNAAPPRAALSSRSTASRAKRAAARTRPTPPASSAASGSRRAWRSNWQSTTCASTPSARATCSIRRCGWTACTTQYAKRWGITEDEVRNKYLSRCPWGAVARMRM